MIGKGNRDYMWWSSSTSRESKTWSLVLSLPARWFGGEIFGAFLVFGVFFGFFVWFVFFFFLTNGTTVLCLPEAALFYEVASCFAHLGKVCMASPFSSATICLGLPSSSKPLPMARNKWCTEGSVLSAASGSVLNSTCTCTWFLP